MKDCLHLNLAEFLQSLTSERMLGGLVSPRVIVYIYIQGTVLYLAIREINRINPLSVFACYESILLLYSTSSLGIDSEEDIL